MARQIIIQERINIPSDFSFRYVFWLSVPSARQSFYANSIAESVVKDVSPTELLAIQNGAIVEIQDSANYLSGTAMSVIQADLVAKFNAYQTRMTNQNPWAFYGSSWDGASWTVKQTN